MLIVAFLGMCSLALAILNVTIYYGNRDLEQQVTERQQVLAKANQLRQFNAKFIQALASLAAQTNDDNIRQVLSDHGVTYTVTERSEGGDGE